MDRVVRSARLSLFVGALLTLAMVLSVALHEAGHAIAVLLCHGDLGDMIVTPAGGSVSASLPRDAGIWSRRVVTAAGMLAQVVVSLPVLFFAMRTKGRRWAMTLSVFGAVCLISVPLYFFWSLRMGHGGDPMDLLMSFRPHAYDITSLLAELRNPAPRYEWIAPAAALPVVTAFALRPFYRAQEFWISTTGWLDRLCVASVSVGVPASIYALLVEVFTARTPHRIILETIPLAAIGFALPAIFRPPETTRRDNNESH